MRQAAERGEHPVGLAAVRLILLTGSSRNEAQAIQRAWVDHDADCVMLPDTKSGAQVRVVGVAAMELIEAQPGQTSNPYVFQSDWTGTYRDGSGNLYSGDKWIADLTAAMLAGRRRQDE